MVSSSDNQLNRQTWQGVQRVPMAISLHLGSSTSCSFLFRPACPPRSVPGLVWVIGPLARGASQTVEFYVLFLFFILFTPISTRSEPGAIWVSRILVLWHRTVIFCVRSVDVHFRPALSPLVCGGGTFVIVLVGTCSPRPPLLVTRRWFSLTVFPSLKDRPPFLPLVLPFLLGFVASPVRGVGVGFAEPYLGLIPSSWNRVFLQFRTFPRVQCSTPLKNLLFLMLGQARIIVLGRVVPPL